MTDEDDDLLRRIYGLKPLADCRVAAEVSIFITTVSVPCSWIFEYCRNPEQALFDIMIENRGEA